MAYLLAKDTVTGAEGSVVVTKEGRNYVVAGMRNITTNAEIQSSDMRVIGTRTIQDKPNGAKLTGTGNIYYGTNLCSRHPNPTSPMHSFLPFKHSRLRVYMPLFAALLLVLTTSRRALCRSLIFRLPTPIPLRRHWAPRLWPITDAT